MSIEYKMWETKFKLKWNPIQKRKKYAVKIANDKKVTFHDLFYEKNPYKYSMT